MRSPWEAAVALAVGFAVVGSGPSSAEAAVYANTTPITIPTQGVASPYGTSVEVSGTPGLVSRVGVELVGAQHQFSADLRVLLVSPAGTAWILNRQGGLNDLNLGNLRIDSDSTGRTFTDLPEPGVHAIEPHRDPGATSMSGPAPPAPYGASVRPLIGGSPNGTWTLYVSDEVGPSSSGSIAGGWKLHLDTTITDRLSGADLGDEAAAIERGIARVQLYRQEAQAPLGALELRVRTVDGTAKAGEDYVATDEIVHFRSGSKVAELEVPTINNDAAEGPETFSVEYVDLPAGPTGVEAPTDPIAPMTIVDDDGPPGIFARYKPSMALQENGQRNTVIPLTRTGSVSAPMTIQWDALGGTGSGADLTAAEASQTIPANVRSMDSLLPSALADNIDEAPIETTNLVLRLNGAFISSAPIQFLDSQGPGLLSVRTTSTSLTEQDPAAGAVFVDRRGGNFQTSENPLATISEGTARNPADYNPTGGNIRSGAMNPGTIGRRVDLTPNTVSDVAQETTEEIRVTLTSSSGSTVDPAQGAVNVPVLDSSPPPGYGGEIVAEAKPAPAPEGTVIRIPVKRVGPTNAAVSATWSTFDVTAEAGRDYEAASGTVSWPAFDQTPREIQITTFQDKLVEQGTDPFVRGERVGVALASPTTSDAGKTIGLSPARVEGFISDDDNTGPGQLDVSGGALTVTEGQPIAVAIKRTFGQTGAIEVTCRVVDGVGNATPGTDLDASAKATFATNVRDSTCSLNTTADALDEPDETLRIELADPTGDAVIGPQSTVDVTITDDDPPGSGPIRLGASEVTVAESGGSVPITIDRGPDTVGDVNALIALEPGTAGAADATLATQRVAIPAGQASTTVDLAIVDDSDDETDTEELRVVLSDPQGGVALGEPSAQRIVITDDDGGGVASISNGDRALEVLENTRAADLVVMRRSGLAPGAGFSWSFVAGTAGNKDVSTRSGSVVFEAGQTEATIRLSIVNDALLEKNEKFRVILSDPLGPLTLAAPTSREIKIIDDDGFAPVKVLSRRLRLNRRGQASVKLLCPKKARRACVGRLSLVRRKGEKAIALGSARYKIKPGRKKVVKVAVKKKNRSLIPRNKSTKVSLRARAQSEAVPPVSRQLRMRRV